MPPYLQKLGLQQIDHLFISRPHRDHYEELAAILDSGIAIHNLYYKIPAPVIKDCCYDTAHFLKFIRFAEDHGSTLISPQTGFKLEINQDVSLELLHAQEGNLPNQRLDVNDLSLIMKLRLSNGMTVLFPGDLNKKLGQHLSDDTRMQADFLKMPHHGLAGIAPNSFFESVDPDFTLVPGPKHLWCSPRGAQARKWTNANQIPTWVNGLNGHITVDFMRDKAIISPERMVTTVSPKKVYLSRYTLGQTHDLIHAMYCVERQQVLYCTIP